MKIKISPSILEIDFSNLASEIKKIEPYADMLHFDVMDGQFVPRITFGPDIVKCIDTRLIKDVHLMINNPENQIEPFAKAGADIITFHIEASKAPEKTIELIKSHNVKAGMAFNPHTTLEKLTKTKKLLNELDMVLLMTVNPGWGGQPFTESVLDKIKILRKLNPELDIQVDGGVRAGTACRVVEAGANVLVAGTAIFNRNSIPENVKLLKEDIKKGGGTV